MMPLLPNIANSSITAAAISVAIKAGLGIWKQSAEWRRYRLGEAKPTLRAKARTKHGLKEMHRHHSENLAVLMTIQRKRNLDATALPFENHIEKLSVLPMPAWLSDSSLDDFGGEALDALTKLQKMFPNFEREYKQTLGFLEGRHIPQFDQMLKTLIVKARVGRDTAIDSYKKLFPGEQLQTAEVSNPDVDKPLDFYIGELP